MANCYSCRYFRPSERKCGYSGYSRTASDECGIAEHRSDSQRCCGNCKYYRPEDKRCMKYSERNDPWHECGHYDHEPA